ncbi:V-type ATP synthase subunit E, partial [Halobacterium salinarum]|nr:V-type ATP synthase subunit E [Halobacterium salinarum]
MSLETVVEDIRDEARERAKEIRADADERADEIVAEAE